MGLVLSANQQNKSRKRESVEKDNFGDHIPSRSMSSQKTSASAPKDRPSSTPADSIPRTSQSPMDQESTAGLRHGRRTPETSTPQSYSPLRQTPSSLGRSESEILSPTKRALYSLHEPVVDIVEPEVYTVTVPKEDWQFFWDYDKHDIKDCTDVKHRPITYADAIQKQLQIFHPGLSYITTRGRRLKKNFSAGFATFYGRCSRENAQRVKCPTTYVIQLKHIPDPKVDVQLTVSRKNDRNHMGAVQKSRILTGKQRKLAEASLSVKKPIQFEVELHKSGNKHDLSDNIRPIGINVAKQIRHQARERALFSTDVYEDLVIRKSRLKEEYKAAPVSGFLHEISYNPFAFSIHSTMQLRQAMKAAKNSNGLEVFFDSTGSLFPILPIFEKKVYLYSLVSEGLSQHQTLPLADFVLDNHDWISIRNRLAIYLTALNAVYDGSGLDIQPIRRVTTDFSFALIKAIISAFNNYMSLGTYLFVAYKGSFHIPEDSVTNEIRPRKSEHIDCIVTLCYSHLMKAFSTNLKNKQVGNTQRRMALHVLANLARAKTFEAFSKTVVDFFSIFLTAKESPAISQIANFMKSINVDSYYDVAIEDEKAKYYLEWETVVFEMHGNMKKPLRDFTPYFGDLTQLRDNTERQIQMANLTLPHGQVVNRYYCRKVVDVFMDTYVPLIPLWAEFQFKFHGNYCTTTNGRVESKFNDMKNNIMSRNRLRPGEWADEIIDAYVVLLRRDYNLQNHPRTPKSPREHQSSTQATDSCTIEEEVWDRGGKTTTPIYGRAAASAKKTSLTKGVTGYESRSSHKSLWGSFHQGDATVFDPHNAGRQCTAICAFAVIYASLTKIDRWTSADLDDVLRFGDQFYSMKRGEQPRHNFLSPEDIAGIFDPSHLQGLPDKFNDILVTVTENLVINATFSYVDIQAGYQHLQPALENILQTEGAFLILVADYTFAILRDDDRVYFIDSHSRDKDGKSVPNGAAVILQYNLAIAAKAISGLMHMNFQAPSNMGNLSFHESIRRFQISLHRLEVQIESNLAGGGYNFSEKFETGHTAFIPPEECLNICYVCHTDYNGSHCCSLCKNKVHAFCGHTNPGSEGYGAEVICFRCVPQQNVSGADSPDSDLSETPSYIELRPGQYSAGYRDEPQQYSDVSLCYVCQDEISGHKCRCSLCTNYVHQYCSCPDYSSPENEVLCYECLPPMEDLRISGNSETVEPRDTSDTKCGYCDENLKDRTYTFCGTCAEACHIYCGEHVNKQFMCTLCCHASLHEIPALEWK